MNILKSRFRFLLPVAILAGAYGVSTMTPNVATNKPVPEVAEPAPIAPVVPEPTESSMPSTTVIPTREVVLVSNPPSSPPITININVPVEPVITEPVAEEPEAGPEEKPLFELPKLPIELPSL